MKALVLLSGGLDSSLALKIILDQGIEVEALHFVSNFCGSDAPARNLDQKFNVNLIEVEDGQELLNLTVNPQHGYGKNINPCIDCRIMRFRKAKEIMQQIGASFIVTGEVLGQRPMSQHRQAIELIERESGLEGLIVRPLCAQVLDPSVPEKEGWVDREALLDVTGRSRKPQIALAQKYQITDYSSPAGGCLLTDPGFSKRLRDIIDHDEITLNNVELIKVGRVFRLSNDAKLVVGRNEKENSRLLELAKEDDCVLEPVDVPGPTAILRGKRDGNNIKLCLDIVAAYCDGEGEKKIEIRHSKITKIGISKIHPKEDFASLKI